MNTTLTVARTSRQLRQHQHHLLTVSLLTRQQQLQIHRLHTFTTQSTPGSKVSSTIVTSKRPFTITHQPSAQPKNTPKMSRPRPNDHSTSPPPHTISLPRILCLHGGGVNAAIFHSQMRSFLSHPSLSHRFRFVFVDAPFECAEGVGVFPVYKEWGPFRRWFRWLDTHEKADGGVRGVHAKIWDAVQSGMRADEGTGEWVAVWGFSQGAKLAGSLMLEQQLVVDARGVSGDDGVNGDREKVMWKFGVLLAGRCPFAALSEQGEKLEWLQSAAGLPAEADLDAIMERPDMRLRLPTVHVHGRKDEGLELHRRAVSDFCAPGSTTVVEWDGPHRVPIKMVDVDRVVDAVLDLASEYGY